MTNAVEGARMVAPPVVPAAVSLALATLLDDEPRPAEVLGTAAPAVWLDGPDGVVMVSTSDAVRLPNSLVIGAPASSEPFRRVMPGDVATIGAGALAFEALRIDGVRWFDPKPVLPPTSREVVAAAISAADEVAADLSDHGLAAALTRDDDRAALEAARSLLGRGDGLTPRGDDIVAGLVAAALLIGGAVGAFGLVAAVQRLEDPLLDLAATATTSFSATLLRHAVAGEVAEPAARLLVALAGRGDPREAARALNRVGHSSGPALTAGVLAGAGAAVERRH